jgi:Trk K+ transport system NAD-binding subunit
LEVALLVQELVPDKRVIVRQSNPAVGRAVTSVLTHSLVVNPADLAGPTFVESVLDERLHRMRIADDEYVVRELQVTRSGRLEELFGELAPILVTHGDGAQVICPSRDCTVQAGDLVALVGTQGELVDVADVPAKPLGTPVRAV